MVRVAGGGDEGQRRGGGQEVGGRGGGGVHPWDGRTPRTVAAVRIQSFLLLTSVTEPDPDNLLLQAETVRDVLNLLAGRLRVGVEGSLQRYPDCVVDGSSLLPPPGERLLGS